MNLRASLGALFILLLFSQHAAGCDSTSSEGIGVLREPPAAAVEEPQEKSGTPCMEQVTVRAWRNDPSSPFFGRWQLALDHVGGGSAGNGPGSVNNPLQGPTGVQCSSAAEMREAFVSRALTGNDPRGRCDIPLNAYFTVQFDNGSSGLYQRTGPSCMMTTFVHEVRAPSC